MDSIRSEEPADFSGEHRIEWLEEALSTREPWSFVSDLAREYWDDPLPILSLARRSDRLKRHASQTKRIGVYYFNFGIGGGEHLLSHAIDVLVGMGYELVLFTDSEPEPGDYPLSPSVERVVIPDYRGMYAEGYRQRAKIFQDALLEHEVDTVLYGAWICNVLPWDTLLIKALGLSLVVYTMSSPSVFFIESNHVLSRLISVYSLVDTVICLSEAYRCFWRGFCDRVFVSVSPLDQDPSQITPAPLCGNEVLWLGRVSYEKNPEDVIPIMQQVTQTVPDAHLSIVGPIEDEMRAVFQAAIDAANLSESITLRGKQYHLDPFYSGSDLLLVTSRYEGFPLAMYECMAAGLPCVTYGLKYLTLVPGNDGCISVPYRDIDAAARAIAAVLCDEERKRHMGSAARSRAIHIASFDYEAFWKTVFEYTEEGKATPESTQDEMSETLDLIMGARRIGVSVDEDAFDQLHARIREANEAGTATSVRFGGILPEGSRRREYAKKLYHRFKG